MNHLALLNFITGKSETVPSSVKGTARLTEVESLQIYRNDYFCRLQGALREQYPMTAKALGAQTFLDLAQQYILNHPSQSWDINDFGLRFPDFLTEELGISFIKQFPFLIELAGLEWANHRLFHELVAPSSLSRLPTTEEEIGKLLLSPKMSVWKSDFQIPFIYRTLQNEGTLTDREWRVPSYYFLSKRNFQVHLEDLNEAQFRFVSAWKTHGTIADVSRILENELTEDDPLLSEIAPTIERMFQLGFCDITFY